MTWIDFTTFIIVAYSVLKGYRDGLIMQVASLLGLVFGAIFAGTIAHFLEPGLSSLLRSSPHIVGPISYLIAFILILVGFSFLGKMVSGFLKAVHVGCLNSIGGSVFCTLKWLLLFSVFLNLVEAMDSREWVIKAETKQKSVTHNFVKALMPTVVPYLSSHDKEKDKNQDAKAIKQSPKNQNTPHRQTKRHATI
jgi:membrane protein required for colicin V production